MLEEILFQRQDKEATNRSQERVWGTACVIAGLDDFRFHDLGHTAATRLADAGTNTREIMAISAIDVFKYLRVTPTPLMRVCDVQWKRLRNGKRGPSQKSPQ